jgi:hypothetical protein
VAVERLAADEPREDVVGDLTVGVEIRHVTADVFVARVAEDVERGLVGAEDRAVRSDPVSPIAACSKKRPCPRATRGRTRRRPRRAEELEVARVERAGARGGDGEHAQHRAVDEQRHAGDVRPGDRPPSAHDRRGERVGDRRVARDRDEHVVPQGENGCGVGPHDTAYVSEEVFQGVG